MPDFTQDELAIDGILLDEEFDETDATQMVHEFVGDNEILVSE